MVPVDHQSYRASLNTFHFLSEAALPLIETAIPLVLPPVIIVQLESVSPLPSSVEESSGPSSTPLLYPIECGPSNSLILIHPSERCNTTILLCSILIIIRFTALP